LCLLWIKYPFCIFYHVAMLSPFCPLAHPLRLFLDSTYIINIGDRPRAVASHCAFFALLGVLSQACPLAHCFFPQRATPPSPLNLRLQPEVIFSCFGSPVPTLCGGFLLLRQPVKCSTSPRSLPAFLTVVHTHLPGLRSSSAAFSGFIPFPLPLYFLSFFPNSPPPDLPLPLDPIFHSSLVFFSPPVILFFVFPLSLCLRAFFVIGL